VIVERNLILSILKMAKEKPVLIEDIKNDVRIPLETLMWLLEKLQNEDLLIVNKDSVSLNSEDRLKLALKVISEGSDIETVSSLLLWQEFESITATALESYGYIVRQNLRFKQAARRWEIDVVGFKKPLVVCVDCKSWHHGLSPSAMRRVVEAQVERTRALLDALPNTSLDIECVAWSKARFVPVVLVLIPCRFKFFDKVPIVPVLQLQDFLSQLPLEIESLKYFQKEFAHLGHDFKQRRSGELEGGNQT
jgi:Holliday junction resolvase-like predicted endonuclease